MTTGKTKKHKEKTSFTMHGLMVKHKIPHAIRNELGKEMANAYFVVTGTKPPKKIKDPTPKKNGQPSFQVAVHPIEWKPIAMNIIHQHLKKTENAKI